MNIMPDVQYEYAKRMLDFFLNTSFSPATDYTAIIGGRPYMGTAGGTALKGMLSDFDGVYERKDADPLYVQVTEELGKENTVLGKNIGDVWASLKRLRTPADVTAVEDAIGGTFTYCGLTYDQYIEANRRAAEKFIRDSLVKGAKAYTTKLSEDMGYASAVVSGCYKPALCMVCGHLGIPKRHVYATEVGFHGRSVSVNLMIGERKYESRESFLSSKNSILRDGIGTERGCYFLINDNPSALEHPFMKAGLNPALITGSYTREELPFDVSTPCPEAREDLTKLIAPMYRFEYAWVAVNTTSMKTQHDLISAARDVMDGLAGRPPRRSKEDIVSKAAGLISAKERRGLVRNADDVRHALARFAASREFDSELAGEVMDYFSIHVPETHADAGMLADLM